MCKTVRSLPEGVRVGKATTLTCRDGYGRRKITYNVWTRLPVRDIPRPDHPLIRSPLLGISVSSREVFVGGHRMKTAKTSTRAWWGEGASTVPETRIREHV